MFRRSISQAAPLEISLSELKNELHQAIIEEFEKDPSQLFTANLMEVLNGLCDELPRFVDAELSSFQKNQIVQSVNDEVQGLGPIAELMLDDEISDILINNFDEVWVEQRGQLVRTSTRFDDAAHLRRFTDRLLEGCGRQASTVKPIIDGKLPDGSRLHVLVPPACVQAAVVSIRKFSHKVISEQFLVDTGYVERPLMNFLKRAVETGVNMVICGNAGAGKTSLMNVLASNIKPHERVVTIEESIELKLHHQHVVQLETHAANSEGHGALTLRDLVRASLRMRADRIIVGEVRGGEAVDMLQAMSCGHQGSITTIHANSSFDAVTRLSTLIQLDNQQLTDNHVNAIIGGSIQLIVHVARDVNGKRELKSVGEICRVGSGFEHNTLYSADGSEPTVDFNHYDSPVLKLIGHHGHDINSFLHFFELEGEYDQNGDTRFKRAING